MTEAASAVSQQSAFRTWAPLIAVLLSLLATSFLCRKKFEVEQEPITRKPGEAGA